MVSIRTLVLEYVDSPAVAGELSIQCPLVQLTLAGIFDPDIQPRNRATSCLLMMLSPFRSAGAQVKSSDGLATARHFWRRPKSSKSTSLSMSKSPGGPGGGFTVNEATLDVAMPQPPVTTHP